MAIQKLSKYVKDAGFVSRYAKPIRNRLTLQQLRDLDKELSEMTPHEWFVKHKGLSQSGAVIVFNYKRAIYSGDGTRVLEPADCDPIVYEQLEEDLDQYRAWKAKAQYAEKKRLEGYAETVAALKM